MSDARGPGPTVELRPIAAGERELLRDAARRYWLGLMPRWPGNRDEAYQARYFEERFRLEAADRLHWWAIADGARVGFARVDLARDQDGPWADWRDFFVEAPFRRRGYGRAFAGAIIAKLAERGCGRIDLNVRRDNPVALAFWQSLGFDLALHHLRMHLPQPDAPGAGPTAIAAMGAERAVSDAPAGGADRAADAGARVRAAYDADPEQEWARLERGTQFRLEWVVTWHALERHLPPPSDAPRVLDAGGGPGRYALELAARGYRVTLLDLSPASLDLARRRLAEAPPAVAGRVEAIVEGSIADLGSFADGAFDAVLCLGGPLSHVAGEAERRRAVAELRRVAAPGAPVLISAMNRFGGYRTVVQWSDSWSLVFPHMLRAGDTTLASGAPAYAFLPEELVALLESGGLAVERLYGCAGLGAHLHEERLAALLDDAERWAIWRDVLLATCDHPNVVGVSNLLLAATRRSPTRSDVD